MASPAREPVDVSVIIPARNRSAYLVETLRLLANQTYPAARTEVIVVDDRSSDGTAAILGGQTYPFRFRCERLEETGEAFWAARPRNAGLRAAQGQVSILVDSDVFVNDRFVEEHVAFHARHRGEARSSVGIGYIYGTAFDNDERTAGRLKPPSITQLAELIRLEQRAPAGWKEGRADYSAAWPDLATCPVPWHFFWTGNVSFPTAAVRQQGGFDEKFRGWGGEDTDLGYRLFLAGARFQWIPRAWGVHYPHPVRPGVEAEVKRNCHYILSKYPESIVETVLWSIRFTAPEDIPADVPAEAWRVSVIQQIASARQTYLAATIPAELPASVVAEVEALQSSHGPGPLLWVGLRPSGHPFAGEVVHSDAFGRQGGERAQDGAGEPQLLGLLTAWPERGFSLAVAAHYWAALPPGLRRPVLRELARLAATTMLIVRDEPAWSEAIASASAILGRAPSAHPTSDGGRVLVWQAARG